MLKVHVIMMGNKPPQWIQQGQDEFTKRLAPHVELQLTEIPCFRRGKQANISRILDKELALMLGAIPKDAYLISLDAAGQSFCSNTLANRIDHLQKTVTRLCFLIGGPEGLSKTLLQKSNERWSLSPLTLPHTLVRVVFLEALYRSWSILTHHPYHK